MNNKNVHHRDTESQRNFKKNRGFGFSVPLWWILSLVMHRTISHPNLLFGTCRCLRNRVRNRARPARRRMPEEIARGYVPAPAAPYFEFPPPLSIRKCAGTSIVVSRSNGGFFPVASSVSTRFDFSHHSAMSRSLGSPPCSGDDVIPYWLML